MNQDIIVATTQDHLDIETIKDDLVITKSGACSLIIQVSAINFGLLSESEQDATIYAYAGLLNSLSFPIQIVIKSDRKDISGYLELLKTQEARLRNETLKARMTAYRHWVETTITEQNVLDKKFYIVATYQPISLSGKIEIDTDLITRAKTDLEPKRDHLLKALARIGLTAQPINNHNLLRLFHSFYNSSVKGQKFDAVEGYEKAVVAPALA